MYSFTNLKPYDCYYVDHSIALTIWAAVTKLFTEVLGHDTSTVLVTRLVGVITWRVVVHVIAR